MFLTTIYLNLKGTAERRIGLSERVRDLQERLTANHKLRTLDLMQDLEPTGQDRKLPLAPGGLQLPQKNERGDRQLEHVLYIR